MRRIRLGPTLVAGGTLLMASVAAQAGSPLVGRWGGDRLNLALDANGGRLDMDCAGGTLLGPLRPDGNGMFSASGTFTQQQPGPQRADELAADAARFRGEIHGSVMTLTIQAEGAAVPQVFQLQRGATVKLVRCL